MNLELKKIPHQILNFEFIEKLDLSFNLLSSLPSNFSSLCKLKILILSNNVCFNNYKLKLLINIIILIIIIIIIIIK